MSVVCDVVFDGLFIHTPSHGYLRVTHQAAAWSGIDVSRYSPSDAAFVYLEEDCDANAFMDALTDAGAGLRLRHDNAEHWSDYIESLW